MQLTNLTLAYLLIELKPKLEGAFLNKAQEIDRQTLKLRFHTKKGSVTLIAMPLACYETQYSLPATQKPSGFAEVLQKNLYNSRLLCVTQHNMDRVIVFEFPKHILVFEFFAKSNVILIDSSRKIIACLRRETWKDRTIAKGETYKFPEPKGPNPAEVSQKQLAEIFSKQKTKAVVALISCLNIAPQVAEEAFMKAGVEKNTNSDELKQRQVAALHKQLHEFYGKISAKKLKPAIVDSELLLPFPLDVLSGREQRPVAGINSALDTALSVKRLTKEVSAGREKKQQAAERLKRSLAEQLQAKERFESAVEENKARAELIYKNFQQIEKLSALANSLLEQKLPEKQIMYKLQSEAKRHQGLAIVQFRIDSKNRKLVLEFG